MDRVALVTGTSSGFGLLTSVALARAGFRVVATMRDPARSDPIEAAARAAGVSVEVERLDVTDAGDIERCRTLVTERHGRLDVLVNNAGYALVGPLETVSDDAFRRQLETNVVGVVATTRAFVPLMRQQRSGRVINVSSMAGRTTVPLMGPYHASKFALEGLSEAWSYELAPFGIRVVVIEPGSFRTDFYQRSMVHAEGRDGPYGPMVEAMTRARRVLERLGGDPARVAATVVHAATTPRPRLRYVVGIDARVGAIVRSLLPGGLVTRLTAALMRVPSRM